MRAGASSHIARPATSTVTPSITTERERPEARAAAEASSSEGPSEGRTPHTVHFTSSRAHALHTVVIMWPMPA